MPRIFDVRETSFLGATVPNELDLRRWDLAVFGNDGLDQRSATACQFCKTHASSHFNLDYSIDDKVLLVGNTKTKFGALRARIQGCKNLLVEATSLNCPEILNLLRCVREEKVPRVSFLYLEPIEYRRAVSGRLSDYRAFDLSHNSRFQSIHGFMTDLSSLEPGNAVFFLGFEKARLAQAFEQEESLQRWKSHAVVGVPAFEPAWEIDTLSNNIDQLAARNLQIHFCAAASVDASYSLLVRLRTDDKQEDPVLAAPLGTKPHTIGAALFLVEHHEYDQAVLLFDHPQRRIGRSKDIRKWHLYDVAVNFPS
jgi:hypothetical protein